MAATMSSISSPFTMPFSHNLTGNDDDDMVLEDAGFFGDTSGRPYDAQKALNELGLQPSPPKMSRFTIPEEEDDNTPFDLDQMLAMEEDQSREQSQAEEDEEEEPYESNGLLDFDHVPDLPHKAFIPIAESTHVTVNGSTPPSVENPTQDRQPREYFPSAIVRDFVPAPNEASTCHTRLPIPRATPIEVLDEQVGLNGLPKYIAAGTMTATLLDGSMIRFEKRRRIKGWKPRPAHYGTVSTELLSQPVHRLLDRVENLKALQVVEAAKKSEKVKAPWQTIETWQERYRPQRFTDLVGEERTHRDVLRWLKEWDTCVFGRKAQLRKRWNKEGADQDAFACFDKYSRPKERILLLGGPAGMGKTTLAHVIAKQCGYLVHELNASDDRSARTVEDRVRDALESKSLKQDSGLPTCLILDEVDGATGGRGEDGGGFIRALIQLIERGAGGATKKRNGKKQRPLLRPIICICNDPYSPNLRALRPYSRLLRVTRPSTPLLMNRLRHICEAESIRADSKGLASLVDTCQGDVRSCLNVLQLLKTEGCSLTVESMKRKDDVDGKTASLFGVKDSNSSLQQIWASLFQLLTTREKAQMRGQNQSYGTNSGEGSKIVENVLSCGEMDKILAGCFEHYPSLKLVDDGWWRFSRMHDWIFWYEHITKRSWELSAQMEMWNYLPWSFVGWKQLFANTGNELPSYPRTDYENHLKRAAYDEITADLITCLPAMTRSHFNTLSIVTELGPSLVTLLSPDLKLINAQLVRPEERSILTSLVDIMRHCNLTFVLDKNEQGQSFYRMEPPLEAFVNFEGKKSQSVGPAKFQLRQVVIGELHAAKARAKQTNAGNDDDTRDTCQTPKDVYGKKGSVSVMPALKERNAVDFFGRPIAAKIVKPAAIPTALPDSILGRRKDKEGKENEAADVIAKRTKLKVFYNYNEGYSNAVRKPVKMASLLM